MIVDYKVVGLRIRKMRKKRNMTQEYLAEMTNLSVVYISSIERAKRVATLDTLVSIVNVLGCTIDDLLDGYLMHQNAVQADSFERMLSDCTAQEKRFLMRWLRELMQYLNTSI